MDLSPRSVALPYGTLQLDVDPSGFEFGGYQLVHFKSLADFQIRGLRNRYRRRGIGAPLAASVSKGEGRVDPWIGPYVKVPVTALLRFDDPRRGMSEGALHGTIQLFYAGDDATTRIGDLTVPLEAERTAALAYQLDGAPVWDFEIAGFRRGDFSLRQERRQSVHGAAVSPGPHPGGLRARHGVEPGALGRDDQRADERPGPRAALPVLVLPLQHR